MVWDIFNWSSGKLLGLMYVTEGLIYIFNAFVDVFFNLNVTFCQQPVTIYDLI